MFYVLIDTSIPPSPRGEEEEGYTQALQERPPIASAPCRMSPSLFLERQVGPWRALSVYLSDWCGIARVIVSTGSCAKSSSINPGLEYNYVSACVYINLNGHFLR